MIFKLGLTHILLIIATLSGNLHGNQLIKAEFVENKVLSKIVYEDAATRVNKFLGRRPKALKWPSEVVRMIKKELKIYRTILIINYDNEDQRISESIQYFQAHLPTLNFNGSHLKGKIQLLRGIKFSESPRVTTLFVIVDSRRSSSMQWSQEMMNFIKQISSVRIRPR